MRKENLYNVSKDLSKDISLDLDTPYRNVPIEKIKNE